jgi:metal-sulfur cluster biosynthetic enzyme
MPGWVEAAARKVAGVESASVNLVFDPPWTPAKMSDEAKLELNML